jgi:hypothetical protein
MTVGGVDTYYDYDEGEWKYRRLGGGPVHPKRVRTDSAVSAASAAGAVRKQGAVPRPHPKKVTAEAVDG